MVSRYGSGPFQVLWQYELDDSITSPSYASGAIVNNAVAGLYEIIATDNKGCTSVRYQANKFFEIEQPDAISITDIISSRPTCHDSDDAYIQIIATGRQKLIVLDQ